MVNRKLRVATKCDLSWRKPRDSSAQNNIKKKTSTSKGFFKKFPKGGYLSAAMRPLPEIPGGETLWAVNHTVLRCPKNICILK